MKHTVLIADDHALVRNGLRLALEQDDEFEVVGEAASAEEAIGLVRAQEPSALLLDLNMPGGLSGREAAAALRQEFPDLAIVVVTMHDDPTYLREMLALGVRGYVLKESRTEELLRALRAAVRGEVWVDASLTAHMVSAFLGKPTGVGAARKTAQGADAALTSREREICRRIAMGYTNAEIAEQLDISKRTVETHRRSIMTKLKLKNRADLVRYAIQNGLLRTW